MALITLPSRFAFSRIGTWGIQRSTNALRSRYTAQSQFVAYPYAVWMLEGDLIDYDGQPLREIQAFLDALEGQKNTFRFPVPGVVQPSTGFNANATASSAAAVRATSIVMNFTTPNVPVFNVGDLFVVNDELKRVSTAIASNGSGLATVGFQPFLRKPVTQGTTIQLLNPYCHMRSADDDVGLIGLSPPLKGNKSFSAVEAIEI